MYMAVRVATLALIGFLLGFLGISAYSGTSFKSVLLGITSESVKVADACPAPADSTHDVFFISCGGIY